LLVSGKHYACASGERIIRKLKAVPKTAVTPVPYILGKNIKGDIWFLYGSAPKKVNHFLRKMILDVSSAEHSVARTFGKRQFAPPSGQLDCWLPSY
jgi:hypothetical protein